MRGMTNRRIRIFGAFGNQLSEMEEQGRARAETFHDLPIQASRLALGALSRTSTSKPLRGVWSSLPSP